MWLSHADGVGLFDFAFIDADKNNYRTYCDIILEKGRPLLRDGGVLVVDNVLLKGTVLRQVRNATYEIACGSFVLPDERLLLSLCCSSL